MIKSTQLIPGHLYEDDKGTQLIFIGIGSYERFAPGNGLYTWRCSCDKSFLYAKKSDIDKKIADGRLDPCFREYDGKKKKGCTTDFGGTILCSQKPRKLIRDLGAIYPETFFKHLTIKDFTTATVFWSITT